MAAIAQHPQAASPAPGGVPLHLHLIRRQLDCLTSRLGLRWEAVPASQARFTLLVPYCYEALRWQVEYQRLRDAWAPDLVMSCEDCNPLLSSLPSAAGIPQMLRRWDMANEQALAQLIDRIIPHFRELQRRLIQTAAAADSRLQFELDTVAGASGPARLDLLFVPEARGQPAKALFMAPLPGVDLRCLRHFIARALPAGELERLQQQLFLRVAYPVGSAAAPQKSLHLPRHLQDLIGRPQLPPWSSGTSLIQYLPDVAEAVQGQCVCAATAADLRWRLLHELAETKLGPAVEMDHATARSALFRISHNGGHTSLFVEVPTSFPEDPPCLTLQSSMEGGGRGEECLQQYPWSARWEPREMAKRIHSVVKDALPKKQRHERPQSAGVGSASPPLA